MADLFLIAPHDAEAVPFAAALPGVLERHPARVLLLPRARHGEGDYKALVKAVIPVAQQRDVAVLIEGDPGDVRMLGADGLHVGGDLDSVIEAVAALKPDFIVGAGGLTSRHDAMERGELDIDYVFFGPLSGPIEPGARALARWWAETMTVPCVLSDPDTDPPAIADEGCEFVAVGGPVWATAP